MHMKTQKLITKVQAAEEDMEYLIAMRDMMTVTNHNIEGVELRQRLSPVATVHKDYYSLVSVVLNNRSKSTVVQCLNSLIEERQKELKEVEAALKGEVPLEDIL